MEDLIYDHPDSDFQFRMDLWQRLFYIPEKQHKKPCPIINCTNTVPSIPTINDPLNYEFSPETVRPKPYSVCVNIVSLHVFSIDRCEKFVMCDECFERCSLWRKDTGLNGSCYEYKTLNLEEIVDLCTKPRKYIKKYE